MTKKVLKNENRSTDQLATVSSRQYFFLSLRHSWINILPHFCISFHVSLVQYEYGRGLWFNCKVSTDSADLSSFHKHWHYRSDRNTQKVVCHVQPLFRNAQVICRKLAHEIANLKLYQEILNENRKWLRKTENTNGFQCWAQDNRPLHQNAFTSTYILSPMLWSWYKNQQHKNVICSEVGVKRLHDIELPVLLACRCRFNLFHSAVIKLMLKSEATIPLLVLMTQTASWFQ